jgi:hypothetical protein
MEKEKGKGGQPGRSGPPGNLNASRHPWRSFWKRRALRASDRWILPTLEQYSAGLSSDKPNLSEAEARVIEIAQTARGATMLILAEAARSGFIVNGEHGWDLAPGAKELAKFLSVERNCLRTLGLERRAKPLPALADYLDSKKDSLNSPSQQGDAHERR